MEHFPSDIIQIIFYDIKLITDKRQFIRLCKSIHKITKQLMIEYEKNFKIDNFKQINNYCVEKFTLELCHDKYFHLMPLSYLNPNNTTIVSALATFGNVELLKIAVNNGCELIDSEEIYEDLICKYDVSNVVNTCALAAQNGHINAIKFCLDNGCKLNWLSCLMAAKNGQLETLKWLKQYNCSHNEFVLGIAAYYGQYEILKWFMSKWKFNDCYCWKMTYNAAINGHLNILELLKENKYEMSETTTCAALKAENLNVLKWLKGNGGIFNTQVYKEALLKGNVDIIKWLNENVY